MPKNILHKTIETYPAKILLFGEYTALLGSGALAIPFDKYSAEWSSESSLDSLILFYEYLIQEDEIFYFLKKDRLEELVKENRKIYSTIPRGYGLGSSGAVVAAVYAYCQREETNLLDTKNRMALMEAFFHGLSSGLDPLVSLQNTTILFKREVLQEVETRRNRNENFELFLLDTKRTRNTELLVNKYNQMLRDFDYRHRQVEVLTPLNDEAIDAYLNSDFGKLFQAIDKISRFQYDDFSAMIPKNFRKIWKKGLTSSDYKLKLCGAGGGGYLLGIAKKNILAKHFSSSDYIVI